ncbi:hypothetical protein EJ03DRAFT_68251 [Teratosphaeria nubilosa]|uniref:CBM21 domain-containing protein n=1 Tax=Teratosphaeria nubilosa TaxID=161662 RepID=A0A6G1KTL7_9PEZI|nr:hypothetical protein EJ03DRAFT_68251 [Teratosphaeria nubilosa]
MPYTPPSQQSPASSKTNSPVLSRSSSYSEQDGYVPRSPVAGRPQPPRSHSSSYLHKHRRAPSIPKADAAPPTPTEAPRPGVQAADFARNNSMRQSPPPKNNLVIPTGMVISPPDSSENSDGDENAQDGKRGREWEKNWDQLKEAVRAIETKREGSPNKVGVQLQETASLPVSQTTSPSTLGPDARRIAHSRSSTADSIMIPKSAAFESPTHTSDDSDEHDGPLSKPALVRKKSGELVKPALRPSSRRRYSSMPGTPTYSKSVHFNEADNQTRHFLQVDKPIAVSAGSSPVETYDSESEFPFDGEGEGRTEREIKLANFPEDTFERKTKPVRVERIYLSADKQTLIGVCAVQNLSFHKLVAARFTLDYWKTTSEVVAEYGSDPRSPSSDNCDRFVFHIKLSDQANIDNKTLLLCVRYYVNGQEYWDNNENMNYRIDFVKTKGKVSKPSVLVNGLGARPLNAIPRSKHTGHSPTATSPRGKPKSFEDDFGHLDNAYSLGSAEKLLGESPSSIKLKPRTKRGSAFPSQQGGPGLGGRYDFGASLSAALTSAQDSLGRKSGLMEKHQKQGARDGYFGPYDRKEGPAKTDERPDSVATDRPAMGSDQYRDLVQKFCYVGSSTQHSPVTSASSTSPSTTAKG